MGPSVKTGLRLCIVVLIFSIKANAFGGQWSSQEARLFSDSAAMHTMQAAGDSCLLSGALEVCQAARVDKGEKSDYFHICPSDGDPCTPDLCYYTSIPPCCPDAPFRSCNSTSKLLVHGKMFDVTFYGVPRENLVCFEADPTLEACGCELECRGITQCLNQTRECDSAGNCECLPNYKPPDCCDCLDNDDEAGIIFYKDPTTGECRRICRGFCLGLDINNPGPCRGCRNGFEPPSCCNCSQGLEPIIGVCRCANNTDSNGNCLEGYAGRDCCSCDTTGNETHAFYMNDNGECIPYCKKNCLETRGDGKGCATCRPRYITAPECCQCEAGLNEINGECRCAGNVIDDIGTCADGYIGVHCCDCDTTGNDTVAFYKEDGKCLPYCKLNCLETRGDGRGCATCRPRFITAPECCQCEAGLNEINGECRCAGNVIDDIGTCADGYTGVDCCQCEDGLDEINGVCRCAGNVIDDIGTCEDGYIGVDCCDCDTTGNDTVAFYKDDKGRCLPYCKLNCLQTRGDGKGCATCRPRYITAPECCQCEDGLQDINGECRCANNTADSSGACKDGYAPEDCCQCAEGFQLNDDGECEVEAPCSKAQHIYFLIDATASNTIIPFCEMMITIQLLVAAFNPTTNGSTKVDGLYFPNGTKLWNSNNTCAEIVTGRLPRLVGEFRECDSAEGRPSAIFPGICGDATEALNGLKEIDNLAQNTPLNMMQAVVMFTDGEIPDRDTNDRKTTISNLKEHGVKTLIAAGLQGASRINRETLKQYTISENDSGRELNAIVKDDVAQLSLEIVNRLEQEEVLCPEHANSIRQVLQSSPLTRSQLNFFCACIPDLPCEHDLDIESYIYPTCGGQSLEYGYEPKDAITLSLEEEIIAAVENVLERNMNG